MSAITGSRSDAWTVSVPLGNRAYDVLIGPGLLARAGELIGARLGAARCAIVTDANVARFHLGALEAAFQAGWPARRLDHTAAGRIDQELPRARAAVRAPA